MPQTSKLGCIATNEPYFCLPSGWDVSGSSVGGMVSPNPEACRAQCDANPSCTHYLYTVADFGCHLRGQVFMGYYGNNKLDSGVQRACIKTTQHPQFGPPIAPASGSGGTVTRLPHGTLCFAGLSVGGGSVTAYGPDAVSTTTSCAQACYSSSNCGHWQLQHSGSCMLFAEGTALTTLSNYGVGLDADAAIGCLVGIAGTYKCLLPRMGVVYTQLGSTILGVVEREGCAELCSGNASCRGFQFTAANFTCVLFSDVFYGPSGANGYIGNAPNSLVVCLRTLSARAVFSPAPLQPPSPPSPPSPPPLVTTSFGGLPTGYYPNLDSAAGWAYGCATYITGVCCRIRAEQHQVPGA